MKDPIARFLLRRKVMRTCGEDGGNQRCRVEFTFGHAQVAADVFTRLKRGRINDRIRHHLCCVQIEQKKEIHLFYFFF